VPRRAELATIVAIITAAVIWWTWGAFEPLPVVQDEYSYVLQSKIFAQGHWTAAPPPVPSSFQQPHVLTAPRVASKFPPGHALLMSPGALVGAPWLVPIILSGVSAALIFLLAESVAGPWIALLCWGIWLGDPINLRFRPGYYSEVTSGLAWLASWWLLRRWYTTKQPRWLVLTALAIGWMAITRPLTALAFAAPVGAFVLARAGRERLWPQVLSAAIAGTIVVAVLPVWNVETTGKWSVSPLSQYRHDYLPFDKPGFGLDSTPPALPLSPVNADVYGQFAVEHRGYTLSRVPSAAVARLRALASDEFAGWRLALVPFVLLGVVTASAELWFAIACAAALFVAYLSYGHWPRWTLYYFEAIPVAAFCAANGVAVCWRRMQEKRPSRVLGQTLGWGVSGLLAILTGLTITTWRTKHVSDAGYDTGFKKMVASAPFPGVVVFVRYAPHQLPHTTVVANSATLATDHAWVVIDDSSRNAAVLRAANGRVPLLFEEKGAALSVYNSLIQSMARRDSLQR
jgi:dolichyl-phosphate-mannose-protein mannosyltransferase